MKTLTNFLNESKRSNLLSSTKNYNSAIASLEDVLNDKDAIRALARNPRCHYDCKPFLNQEYAVDDDAYTVIANTLFSETNFAVAGLTLLNGPLEATYLFIPTEIDTRNPKGLKFSYDDDGRGLWTNEQCDLKTFIEDCKYAHQFNSCDCLCGVNFSIA